MWATLCLLGDFDAENFCREFMTEASIKEDVGVAAANLPRHISLGLPYEVKDWDAYVRFADELATKLHPVTVRLTEMGCIPIGDVSGNYHFKFVEGFGLDQLRLDTVHALNSKLGLSVPEKDGVTGQRNITLGFGKAPFANYQKYVGEVDSSRFEGKELTFDQLGIFYYDSDKITPTSFFCCKRYRLK